MGKTNDNYSEKYIFIAGCPRSGTTWIWKLLTENTNIEPMLIENMKDYQHPGGIKKMKNGDTFNTTETGLLVSAVDDKNIIRIANDYVNSVGEKKILEKTPSNALVLDKLFKLFPNSKVVYVVRDPRATINSITQSVFNKEKKKLTESLDEAIELFNKYYEAMKLWINDSRVITVKYEDLKNNGQKTMDQLYSSLGIPTIKHDFSVKSAITKNSNDLRKGEIDSYLQEMSKADIKKVCSFTKEYFEQFNYRYPKKFWII